jgi:hypothetical protein
MASATIQYEGSKLTAALVKFQADLPDIGLDSENPHFRSKFASLPNITKIVLPKLAAQGLSFSAGGVIVEGQFGLSASLLHESGEERSGFFPITATDPQKIGSAITYARRYLLASLTGIVADADDDGNAASIPSPVENRVAAAKQPAKSPATARQGKNPEQVEIDGIKVSIRKFIEAEKITSEGAFQRTTVHEKKHGKNKPATFQAVLDDLKKEFPDVSA